MTHRARTPGPALSCLVLLVLGATTQYIAQTGPEAFDSSFRLETGEVLTGGYFVEGGQGRYLYMDTEGLEKGGLFEPISDTALRSVAPPGTVEIEFVAGADGAFHEVVWREQGRAPIPGERGPSLDVSDFESRLTRYIEQAMGGLQDVPGLAVAVVRDTGAVYVRGFGHSDIEADRPVTPETVFYIASHSKALVGTTASVLAHDGVLNLDAPLSRYLPELSFRDAGLSADSITVRDLLTHTSGILNPAITWSTSYTGQHSADELVRILGEHSRAGSRSFAYTNVGYVVAGLIVERITGADWRHVVADRVLRPVGMGRTTGFVTEVERRGWPLARPYSALGNPPHNVGRSGLERIPFWKTNQTIQGAGGHLSTVRDLARWVRLQLNDGLLDGEQVLPPSVVRSVRQPHADLDATFYRFHRTGYGLGWYVSDFRGENLVHHFGAFAGYRTHVSFMPERGIGVVALVNEIDVGFFLPDFVASCAYALLLEQNEVGTACDAEREDLVDRSRSRLEDVRRTFQLRLDMPPRPLSAYTGRYHHPAMGTLAIARRGEQLHAVLGLVETALDPWQGDTLRMEFGGAGTALRFDFEPDTGKATSVVLQGYRLDRVLHESFGRVGQ